MRTAQYAGGRDSVTGKKCGDKTHQSTCFDDLVDTRRIWREVSLLRLLRDSKARHILPLLRLLVPSGGQFRHLYIVTQLCYQSLRHYISHDWPTEAERDRKFRSLAVQMLTGIYDMHRRGVIHRDMKSSNVLLGWVGDLYICDFGLARGGLLDASDVLMTDYMVTRWYRPPELLTMSHYSFPADVWGVGCILAEIVMQRPPFMGRNYMEQLALIVECRPVADTSFIDSPAAAEYVRHCQERSQNKGTSVTLMKHEALEGNPFVVMYPLWIDLIEKLLVFNPASRLTAEQALRHPLFVGEKVALGEPFPPINFDFSLDGTADLSEARLRRKLVEEIAASNDSS